MPHLRVEAETKKNKSIQNKRDECYKSARVQKNNNKHRRWSRLHKKDVSSK